MRTLTWKLVLAFLAISLAVALLGALIVRWLTVREFDRLVLDQAQTRFVAEVSEYYQYTGSWAGIRQYLQQRTVRPQPQAAPGQTPRRPLPQPLGNTAPFYIFALTDQDGLVVLPAGPYRLGERLSAAELADAARVELDGQVVGYALATGEPPELEPREERYLVRANQALLIAALGAMLIALPLSVVLARALTRPLRELTRAIRAMARGDLGQQVPVRSQDELGQLAVAFNQMSADLARANQARRQMTADIAHDLRTPLTVIGGYVEALRDGVLKPDSDRFDTMYNEVQHLQHLVEDLRTLSLADSGELILNRQSLQPVTLLERIAAAYWHRAEQQGIQLQIKAPQSLRRIYVDEERMVQVLGNLVSNSLRHTPQGGQIVLSSRSSEGALQILVQDTGEGIPPQALPFIFDRFYRGDASRPGKGDESGLGLAIARSIVEAHGGTISADSSPGHGTTFTIWLPTKG